MKISGVKAGDIVECDVRGRVFLAKVTRPADANAGSPGLEVEPIHAAITYRHVGARQVIGHWARRGRRRPTADAPVA